MATRLAVWVLVLAAMVHVSNLWPMPGEVAAQRLAFWSELRSKAVAREPAKSERRADDANVRDEMLRDIDAVLADPDQLVAEAWFHWALYLGAAVVAAFTAVAALRRWRHWPWPAAACATVYFWLYRPHTPLRFFYPEGQLDFSAGISQLAFISKYPGAFFGMVINALVAVLLVVIVVYGLVRLYKTDTVKGVTHAP